MVNLNRKRTSKIIWETLLENVVSHPKAPWVEQMNMLDALRATAKSPTGSVSVATFWCLYAVVQAFKPKRVAEVGTYIGRSTLAMARGAGDSLRGLFTCDMSFDTWKPPTAEEQDAYAEKLLQRLEYEEEAIGSGIAPSDFTYDRMKMQEFVDRTRKTAAAARELRKKQPNAAATPRTRTGNHKPSTKPKKEGS